MLWIRERFTSLNRPYRPALYRIVARFPDKRIKRLYGTPLIAAYRLGKRFRIAVHSFHPL